MSQRITQKFLEAQAATLNRMSGLSGDLYRKDENGRILGGIKGTYLISCAYGGYALHTMCNSTGQKDVFNHGHIAPKELSGLINAYMRGLDAKDAS